MIPVFAGPDAIEISATDTIQRIDPETEHHRYEGQPQNHSSLHESQKHQAQDQCLRDQTRLYPYLEKGAAGRKQKPSREADNCTAGG